MSDRADNYVNSIIDQLRHLDSCVRFIDCSMIQKSRSVGVTKIQKSVLHDHKRFHCLVYNP